MGRGERKGRGGKVELIQEQCCGDGDRARADAGAICAGRAVTKQMDPGTGTSRGCGQSPADRLLQTEAPHLFHWGLYLEKPLSRAEIHWSLDASRNASLKAKEAERTKACSETRPCARSPQQGAELCT